MQTLFEVTKERNMVEALWGKNARVSKDVPTQGKRRRGQVAEEVSAYTLNANKSFATRQICYHASMVPKRITGIFDVDKTMDVTSTYYKPTRKGRGGESQSSALQVKVAR